MRPLDHIMSITNSQHMKPSEPDHTVKHAHQMQIIAEEQTQHKEKVAKIPDEHNAELMESIKQGLDSHAEHHSKEQKESVPDEGIIEKELLDDNHGNNIDIII